MRIDVHSTIIMLSILASFAAIWAVSSALKAIRSSRKIPFYFKRRQLFEKGLALLLVAVLFFGFAYTNLRWGEKAAYQVFPPSLTPSLTPTITLTPTISLTPTNTLTPTLTYTPSITNTPAIPDVLATQFVSLVTPNPNMVFSSLTFATEADKDFQPVEPGKVFENPLRKVIGFYSYNNMDQGVQWSEVWLRDGEPIQQSTSKWEGGSGGYGLAILEMPAEEWLPGAYELQLFVGEEWLMSGYFTVVGEPPLPSATPTATSTPTPTRTLIPSITPIPTRTLPPPATP